MLSRRSPAPFAFLDLIPERTMSTVPPTHATTCHKSSITPPSLRAAQGRRTRPAPTARSTCQSGRSIPSASAKARKNAGSMWMIPKKSGPRVPPVANIHPCTPSHAISPAWKRAYQRTPRLRGLKRRSVAVLKKTTPHAKNATATARELIGWDPAQKLTLPPRTAVRWPKKLGMVVRRSAASS